MLIQDPPGASQAASTAAVDPDSLVRFADLLKLRGLAPATRKEYFRYVRKVFLGLGRDPAELTEEQVRAYLLQLKARNYSPSTMRTAVASMNCFYTLSLGRSWNLFDLVRNPVRRTLPKVLTREEVARLFSVLPEERFRVLFRLIYACGLRISEAAAVGIGDIRHVTRLLVRNGKGGRERYVPLPRAMRAELLRWWGKHRNPRWMFPVVGRKWRSTASFPASLGTAERPMPKGTIQFRMRRAVADASLPAGTCVHTLRHSYATHLLDEGVSIRLISEFLGHSSLETTLVYTHLTEVNETDARAAAARLVRGTKGGTPGRRGRAQPRRPGRRGRP